VRITADSNVLLRATVGDNPAQEGAASKLLAEAELVAIPITVFCEVAWVLASVYRFSRQEIGAAILSYLKADTVVTNTAAVKAGLAFLAQGGDFADGAIAHEGRASGGTFFASFDRRALKLLAAQGEQTILPVGPS
jgi:predicted nucleic-acid-binding protein